MPLHDHRCTRCKAVEERHVAVADLDAVQWHNCQDHGGIFSAKMERVFLTPPMGFVQRDVCYDSPIDGRAVTNKHARIEDLRRNNCVEYDPGMRQDAERRRKADEAALDRSVESTVDEWAAKAGPRKLEKLDQEMHAGVSVEVNRSTPDMTKGVAQ